MTFKKEKIRMNMKEFKIQTLAMKKQILMAVDKTDTLCFTQKQHICNNH